MERFIQTFLIGVVVMLGFVTKAFAIEVAETLQYPFSVGTQVQYDAFGLNQGFYEWNNSWNGYHLAHDVDAPVGTKVYASANGTVVESQNHAHGGYGSACGANGYIVLVESQLVDGTIFTVIYGHVQNGTYNELGETGLVPEGTTVQRGQYIATVADYPADGDDIGTECGDANWDHLHFGIRVDSYNSADSIRGYGSSTDSWVNPRDFISRNGVPTSAYTAITAKADEMWAIRPSGSGVSCEEYASSGLICHETENMHWWAGLSDSYVIETWTDGTKGEVDLTFDPDNTDQDRAYVVWGGFREMFHLDGHPDEYGPPIGDELDSTFDEYTGYDRYCDWDIGDKDGQVDSRERDNCIQVFCGSLSTYTSVQRFKDATLCWNADTWEAECDPKWPNEHCHEASGLASTPTPLEDDLLVYNSTIYWIHNGSTHGIVSAEMFEACGFSWSDPYPVTEDTFNLLPQGSLLDDPTDCGAVTDGTLVTQNSTVYEYWSEDASWHGYPSDLVFDACLNDWSSIQEMSSSVFNTITIGSVVDSSFECGMTYPGLLLSWNGTVYRITETGLKRGFTSSDVFSACGYDWNDVWALALDDYPVVTTLQDGSAISSTSDCANITGDLVHWEWTGTIYYLTGTGYKRGITSTEAMTSCGFDWNQVRYVTNANGAVVWTLGDAANITGSGDCP